MKAYARALSNFNPFAIAIYVAACASFGVVVYLIAWVSA